MRLSASQRDRSASRLLPFACVLLVIGYSLAVNHAALRSPPGADSSITVVPAALTVVQEDFDVWKVAQMAPSPQGGPSTHATSIYTIGYASLISVFGARTALYMAHLGSILTIGALALATFLLTRERSSALTSAVAAVSVGVIPLMVQQASDVYLDLPLAVIATLACLTSIRRRYWWTVLFVVTGVAIKPTGIFLLPLLVLARPRDEPLRRGMPQLGFGLSMAIVPLLPVLATTHRFSGVTTIQERLALLGSSATLLALTIDVLVVMCVYSILMTRRVIEGHLDRHSIVILTLVVGFFVIHVGTILVAGTIAVLPRYYVLILPAVVASLAPEERAGQRPNSGLAMGILPLTLLAVFSILNVHGDLYQAADHDFYPVAERSTRAQDLIALKEESTKRVAAVDLPVLANRQLYFRLEYPGLGFVEERPTKVVPVFLETPEPLPRSFVMLDERHWVDSSRGVLDDASADDYKIDVERIRREGFWADLVLAERQ